MGLLSPITSFDKELAILENTGVVTRKENKVEEDFLKLMEMSGLSKDEVLGTIAQVMANGSSDSVKLIAAKTALQMYMHPAFVPRKEMDRADRPIINFNISGGDIKMQNILTPQIGESFDEENRG